MKELIITEKPSVAALFASALNVPKAGQYYESSSLIIAAAAGHLVALDYDSDERRIEQLPVIPHEFQCKPIRDKRKTLNLLSQLMKRNDVSKVTCATDGGREGENIFRLIYEFVGCNKPMFRIWPNSMQPSGLVDSFNKRKPGSHYDNLYRAARQRSEWDWIFGVNLTRGLTDYYRRKHGVYRTLSGGRVQSVVLSWLVFRERAIANFQPVDFWTIKAKFTHNDAESFIASLHAINASNEVKFQSSELAEQHLRSLIDERGKTVAANDTVVVQQQSSPMLYDLTTLQREANRQFKFSAKKTLDLAQVLYEKKGLLTYPRTDSRHLVESAEDVRNAMDKLALLRQLNEFQNIPIANVDPANKRVFDSSKVTDHFAIIPDGIPRSMDELSNDERVLYDMVCRRFLAAFLPNAQYRVVKKEIVIEAAGNQYLFLAKGRELIEPGWLSAYPEKIGKISDDQLALSQNDRAVLAALETEKGKTSPPSRFTEDRLLAAMETAGKLVNNQEEAHALKERGLGTPATRASIIETLLSSAGKREAQASRLGKEQFLVPTQFGTDIIETMEQIGLIDHINADTSGHWEFLLRQIEKGELNPSLARNEISNTTQAMMSCIRAVAVAMPDPDKDEVKAMVVANCPKCGHEQLSLGTKRVTCVSCGWSLPSTMAKREFSQSDIVSILTASLNKLEPPLLTGFVSSKNKPFDARVKLKPDLSGLEFLFDSNDTEAVKMSTHCPKCGSSELSQSGIKLSCSSCDFTLWTKIAKRSLSQDEVLLLLQNRRVDSLTGFVSAKGKPFAANLVLKHDFSVGFEFN